MIRVETDTRPARTRNTFPWHTHTHTHSHTHLFLNPVERRAVRSRNYCVWIVNTPVSNGCVVKTETPRAMPSFLLPLPLSLPLPFTFHIHSLSVSTAHWKSFRVCLTRRASIVTITSPTAQICASNETPDADAKDDDDVVVLWVDWLPDSGQLNPNPSRNRIKPILAFYVPIPLMTQWMCGKCVIIFNNFCVVFSTFCNLWLLLSAIADGLCW